MRIAYCCYRGCRSSADPLCVAAGWLRLNPGLGLPPRIAVAIIPPPMLNLLRKCALLLLILSLPMQSQHALAMLLCSQGYQSTAAQQYSNHWDAAEHDANHQAPDINLTCNGCGMYHTCSAPAIASNILDVSLAIVATLQATPSSPITLFIPEQPQRPPRA